MRNIFIVFCILSLTKIVVLPEKVYSNGDTTIFRPSIRFGTDLYYPARMIIEPEIRQFEASIDFEFTDRLFAVFEGGGVNTDIEREKFNYLSYGYFFRTGIDFNIISHGVLDDNDIIYIGLRYGFSDQQHRADNITIQDDYWGDFYPSDQRSDFEANWGELVFGLKTELFSNFFIGWSIRYRLLFSGTDDALLKPYIIGGFGRLDHDNSVVNFNYSIYYRISF